MRRQIKTDRPSGAAGLAAFLLALLVSVGCDSGEPSILDAAGLAEEYIGIDYPDDTVILRLGEDGRFVLLEGVPDCGEFDPDGPTIASGDWSFSRDELLLTDGEWTARFRTGRTRVEAPIGADTLSSLRWVTSTAGSPFGAYDLIVRQEFRDLLQPPEGTGSSGG